MGRRLVGATKGNVQMSFTYNDEGLRTSKTVDGVTTNFYYDGSLLIKEETPTYTTVYIYDVNGSPVGFKYRTSTYDEDVWDAYCYQKNLQNDIIAVYNSNGVKLISYKYNAWGITTTSYSNGGANTTAVNNRLTYRGYYYDTDLGMYYLQSRYYDQNTCRFINADDVSVIAATPTALTDKNLFAYCDNNPVMRVDYGGHFWGTVFDVLSLGFSIAEVIATPCNVWSWLGLAGDIVDLLPIVSGVGEGVDMLRIANKADDVVGVARTIDNAGEVVELHRPYIRKSTREAVEAVAAKTADGKYFLDANTGEIIFGKCDLGHVTGNEFWREKQIAMQKGWTQKQFNDYMNNPKFYRIELPHNNRSHRFEMPR